MSPKSFHPYRLLKAHHLLPEDFERRQLFCKWLLKWKHNKDIVQRILFTDEFQFRRNGFYNIHNDHLWLSKTPQVTSRSFQEHFFNNIWCGVIDNTLVEPICLKTHRIETKITNFYVFLRDDLIHFVKEDLLLQLCKSGWSEYSLSKGCY